MKLLFSLFLSLLTLPLFAQTPLIPLPATATSDDILDALHARGQNLKAFTANVSLDEIDALSGDTTTLVGKTLFQDKGDNDSRLLVAFTKKVINKKESEFKQIYLLDAGWLTDRDYKNKIEVKRQTLKPGQKINLIKLGEGPFPLPVGQPREEVLKMFDVKLIPPAKTDPENTLHITLSPKPQSQFERKFKEINVWVQTTTHFPIQIATTDKRETTERITHLNDITLNPQTKDADFTLDKIDDSWTKKTEELD